MSTSASGTASNQNQDFSSNRGSVTITKSKSNSNNSSVGSAATAAPSIDETPINRMEALNAKPGTQIKITRTPTGSVEFTTVPAAGGGGISNTAVPGMSATSDVTITRAPHAHGGAHGGGHAQSSLGNGFAPQVPTASLGQKIFDQQVIQICTILGTTLIETVRTGDPLYYQTYFFRKSNECWNFS